MEKRKYFLKVPRNFFDGKTAELFNKYALRHELYMLYFWMLLEAAQNNGRILRNEKYGAIEWQLAEMFEETREVMQSALLFFLKNDLVIREEGGNLYFPECLDLTYSETASAERMRRHRKKEKHQKYILEKNRKNAGSSDERHTFAPYVEDDD